MILPNIENFIGCDSSFEEAEIVLYGAPFDSTTSFRPGARFGPSAIRHESFGLETYSPYQDRDLMDIQVFDSGDLELCFGSSEKALADIQDRAEEILKEGKMPLLLGGEHLVTLAAVRAVAGRYPELHIIHFDAHADLRDDYLGAHLSHACVSADAMGYSGDGRYISLYPKRGKRRIPGLQKSIQIFIPLPLNAWKKPYRNWPGSRFRYILPLIWTVWIHLYFREPVHRRQEA